MKGETTLPWVWGRRKSSIARTSWQPYAGNPDNEQSMESYRHERAVTARYLKLTILPQPGLKVISCKARHEVMFTGSRQEIARER